MEKSTCGHELSTGKGVHASINSFINGFGRIITEVFVCINCFGKLDKAGKVVSSDYDPDKDYE